MQAQDEKDIKPILLYYTNEILGLQKDIKLLEELKRQKSYEPTLQDGFVIAGEILNSIELARLITQSSDSEIDYDIISRFLNVLSKILEYTETILESDADGNFRNWLLKLRSLIAITLEQLEEGAYYNNPVIKQRLDNNNNISRPDIIKLQQSLNALGYKTFADGIIGPSTERAILNYKADRNLSQTTDVDKGLLLLIEHEIKERSNPKYTSGEHAEDESSITTSSDLEISNELKEKLKNVRLLLVEDNEFNRMVAEDTIKEVIPGITIDTAVNGAQAIDKLQQEQYDIVLMDIQMPIMDGITATQVIRNKLMSPAKDVPIIAITANVLEEDVQQYFDAGMNGCVAKPFHIQELFSTISNLIDVQIKKGIFKNTKKSYRATLTTEGNHAETDDKLQFENDIISLATVISLKDVKPPLAIGLFGNWGSGKSFFMEKLISTINDFTKGENEGMVKNVVQVKFNSWHYSDANLWASLITEIFDSLHAYATRNHKEEDLQKLSQTLHITGLQKEEAEKKKKELEERIHHLKEKQQTKRQRLEDVSGIGLLKLVLSDKLIHKDLDELNNNNIEALVANRDKIDDYITEVEGGWNKLQYILRSFADMKGGRWIFVIAIAVIAFSIPYLLKWSEVAVFWNDITFGTAALMSAIATALAQLLKTIQPALTVINTTAERLKQLRKTIDARDMQTNEPLNSSEQELKELTESLQHIDEKIKETRKEISDIKSGKRLLEFIQNRSKDESYAQQLGLISWIRKDFQRLDDLLRKQYKLNAAEQSKLNPTNVQLQIDRIVLYIDDLDRCKEDVVVKVLEAVHLLLAFPLFVVVVGVDPRWLNNALAKQYEAMFKNNNGTPDKQGATHHNQVATTYDYLEKIFQVPFALKPINKNGQGELITYLLRNEMAKPEITFEAEKKTEQSSTGTETGTGTNTSTVDVNFEQEENRDEKKEDTTTLIDNKKPEQAKPPVILPEPITFTTEELSCMKRLSPIFGHTPRGINRYVNIYRIIKSHNSLKIEGEYDEDEYVPILFMLAIVVGYSTEAKKFISVMEAANNADNLKATIEAMNLSTPLAEAIMGKEPKGQEKRIPGCLTDEELNMQCEPFKRNLELISRFSFRTIMC